MHSRSRTSCADWQHGFPAELWVSEVIEHLEPIDIMVLSQASLILAVSRFRLR